jgi:hypothetical protein
MSEQLAHVAEMVTEILARLPALDANRRHMLFLWLQAHHSAACFTDSNLGDGLTEWLGALPVEGIHWEYHLILSEIAWWRDLDERSLAEFMRSERALSHRDQIGNGVGSIQLPLVSKS